MTRGPDRDSAHPSEDTPRLTRVLHIIASVDVRGGGPIEGVLQQVRQSPADRFSFHIASLDSPEAACVASCPMKVFALGDPTLAPGWKRLLPWRRYGYRPRMLPWLVAHQNDYDVVVVNGLWNYSAMAAGLALVGSDVPYAVFTHGMLDPWFRKTDPLKTIVKQVFWLFSEGRLLNNAAAVLFTTRMEQEVSRNAFRPYHVAERVVGFGTADIPGDPVMQERTFREAVPATSGRPYLLYLSRIHPKKGCDLLIEAFASVAAQHPEIDLVIAGPDRTGWRPELETRAAELGVAQRIHWPGMLTGDCKWGAYRACEAFVLPSHQENFGVVVAEAMAAGKPVLISDKVQIHHAISEGGGGLVASDTVEGARRLLSDFLALDPAERAAMGAAARATFLEKFEIGTAIGALNATLLELAARRRDRPAPAS